MSSIEDITLVLKEEKKEMSALRCTQKLLALLPPVLCAADSTPDCGLGDWHAHLLTLMRKKCIVVVHDHSRYALLLPALKKADLARLPELFREHLAADLRHRQCSPDAAALALEGYANLVCSSGTDRSVLGRVNEAAAHIDLQVRHVGRLPEEPIELFGLSLWLNTTPCSAKGEKDYFIPEKRLLDQLNRLSVRDH